MRWFWRGHYRDSKLAPCYETCLFLNAWGAKDYTSNWKLVLTEFLGGKLFYSISTHIWRLDLTLVFRVSRKCLAFFLLISKMCASSDQLKKNNFQVRIMWYQDSSYKWLSDFSGSSLSYATLVMVLFILILFIFSYFSHIETQEPEWRLLLKGTFSYFIFKVLQKMGEFLREAT